MSLWLSVGALVVGGVLGLLLTHAQRQRLEGHETPHVHTPTPAIAPWFGRCYTCGEMP